MWQMRDFTNVYVLTGFGVIALLGNGFILLTGVANRKLRNSSTDVTTLSLSLADLCMALVTVPCHVLISLQLPHDVIGCLFVLTGFLVFHLISILNLLILTLEKFVVIRFPFAYQRFYTPKRALQLCAASWLLGKTRKFFGIIIFFILAYTYNHVHSCNKRIA